MEKGKTSEDKVSDTFHIFLKLVQTQSMIPFTIFKKLVQIL